MTIAFISDIHITPEHPASIRLFEEFLNSATNSIERLYILGDLFDYWVGDDGSDRLGHDPAEAALRKLADSGTQLFFMHGNRDFLIGEEFAKRTGCTLLADPTVISLDQRKVLLTHGDMLCTDDVEHQHARKEMLSDKWKMAFLEKPLTERIDTAAGLRATSENKKSTKSMAEMDVNQSAVEALMKEHNVNTLVHGHTHQPAVHEFTLAKKPAWRYVLGDWHERCSALYYQDGNLDLT